MKMKTLVMAAVTVLAAAFGSVKADPVGSVSRIDRGVWCNNWPGVKAAVEAENVPVLIFWANPGCGQCEKMEHACNTAEFRQWMSESGMYFVFVYGSKTKEDQWCKTFAKNPSGEYPYMCVYWPENTSGREVKEVFAGRTGKIGHGTSSTMALGDQLMTGTSNILSDWAPCAHDWGVGVEMSKPTCTTAGETVYTCSKCQRTRTVTRPALGHRYDENHICGRCGEADPYAGRIPVAAKEAFKRAQTGTALVSDGDVMGTAKVSLGKISSTKGTVKVAVTIKTFDGKTYTANTTVKPDLYGDMAGELKFKSPIGVMPFEIEYDGASKTFAFWGASDSVEIESSDFVLGGKLTPGDLTFTVGAYYDILLPKGYSFEGNYDSDLGTVHVSATGKKMTTDKASVVKFHAVRFGDMTEYFLDGLDDALNPNAIKLTYSAASGKISGSFKIYTSNRETAKGKPTLKAYTMKVSGVVLNGEGIGTFSGKIGSATYGGSCALRRE